MRSDSTDMSESDCGDDLSSLDLDEMHEMHDREHFMPPSERYFNRHANEAILEQEALSHRNMEHFFASLDDSADDESLPTPKNKGFASEYHSVVFPGMKIPVDKPRESQKLYQGMFTVRKDEIVPVMSVQCPLPGGDAVTMVTDPVQRVSWGPLTRIEASKEARDVVKEFQKTPGTTGSKRLDRGNKNKNTTTAAPTAEVDDKIKDDVATEEAENSASQAGTDFSDLRARFLMPPPPTPPDEIFHSRLSMPTLPELHRISVPNEVEQYRLERAKDPDAFDKETRALKSRLVDHKIARGGLDHLLNNEYTVELACREDAVMVEKWISGRTASMRSRFNTTSTPPITISEKTEISGGEKEDLSDAGKVIEGAKDKLESIDSLQNKEAGPKEDDQATGRKSSTDTTETEKPERSTRKNRETTSANVNASREDLKARFNSIDISSHVSKVITSGSVRHQHSEKREISDSGEKRTVTTWIQIEEVYQVPNPNSLTWKDVATAVKQENNDGGRGEGNKEGLKVKKNQAKRHRRSNVHGKQRKASDDSSEWKTESGTSDDSVNTHSDQGQTTTEILLEILSRLEGQVNQEGVGPMVQDLKQVLTVLRGNGELMVEEEA